MVLISLSETKSPSSFEVNYVNPLIVPKGSEITLISANIEYSWYNISDKLGNNKIKINKVSADHSVIYQIIEFPNGLYDLEDIQDFINDHYQGHPPIEITGNHVTFKTMITVKPGFKLNLGKLATLLGFEDKSLVEGEHLSSHKADITAGINRILIHCSVVGGSYNNNLPSDVIYSFTPREDPGNIMHIEPNHPIYLPLRETTIYTIRIRITDQHNREIDLRETGVDLLLHVREK